MANSVELRWFGPHVSRSIKQGMTRRVKKAASQFRRKVVKNISIPVNRKVGVTRFFGTGELSNTAIKASVVVTKSKPERSKPGEFPRTDTARLRRDIFWEMTGPHEAVIGTTLDYGAILEFRMQRSFLRRTLAEQRRVIMRTLIHGPPRLTGQGKRG